MEEKVWSADLSTRHGCRPAWQRGHSICTSTAQGGASRELLKVGGYWRRALRSLGAWLLLGCSHPSGSHSHVYLAAIIGFMVIRIEKKRMSD